jgi:hypothetical protein
MDSHDSRPRRQQKPPISSRKIAANRRNGKRSPGPKTSQGKEISKRNSYKTGIFARQLFSHEEEGQKEWERYKDIVARIYLHYQPEGVMEELLVDKVVTEAVRFARLLRYEGRQLAFPNAFWNQGVDRVLRYQAAINRQLSKAIEQLEDLQAQRKTEPGTLEPSSGPEPYGLAAEVELSAEVIAAQPPAPAPGEKSYGPAETSSSGPQPTENYKTNPPKPSSGSGSGNDGTAHEKAGPKRSLVEIVDRVMGTTPPQEPNNRPVTTSDSGTKSQDSTPKGPSEDEIAN